MPTAEQQDHGSLQSQGWRLLGAAGGSVLCLPQKGRGQSFLPGEGAQHGPEQGNTNPTGAVQQPATLF